MFNEKVIITVGVGQTENGEPISIGQQQAALRDAMKLLADKYGGVTLRAAKGAYVMQDGDQEGSMVYEDAAELVVFKSEHISNLVIEESAELLKKRLEQESVLVSVEKVHAVLI